VAESRAAFEHSTPALYDRFMGPLLFKPWAKLAADRAAALRPGRILETAAGTGILTRALNQALPEATIVATDLNPAVVTFAEQSVWPSQVSFQTADAQDLPLCGSSGSGADARRAGSVGCAEGLGNRMMLYAHCSFASLIVMDGSE
jgi:hypothetical protein